jgi:hypothetical protein
LTWNHTLSIPAPADRCVVDHYDEEVKAMVKKILDAYDSPAAANRTRYKQVPSWSLAEQCLLHHLAMVSAQVGILPPAPQLTAAKARQQEHIAALAAG